MLPRRNAWYVVSWLLMFMCLVQSYGCASGGELSEEDMGTPTPSSTNTADAYMRPTTVSSGLDAGSGQGTPVMGNPGQSAMPANPNMISDASLSGPDRFIPAAPAMVDMGAVSAPETLSECVDGMINKVRQIYAADTCDQYSDQDKENPASRYFQTRGTAACIKVECAGVTIEGHNGIMALRTCRDLDDLVKVLDKGRDDALGGSCMEPKLQIRFVPEDEFVGMEPCDQYVCGLDREGQPIIGVDN